MDRSEFWQALLSADLPVSKAERIASEFDHSIRNPAECIAQHPLLSPAEAERAKKTDLVALERALSSGATILEPSAYPETLQEVVGPPAALFINGDSETLHAPTVGIVGTRDASPYGRAVANKIAHVLAAQGVSIVSGGALGIDAAAHQGALSAGGNTVIVLAGGINNVFPAVHAGLFRQVKESGCLISQFAAGAKPYKPRFLARNVTIAALSRALVVVEAPEKSGALSTARAAAEMGRNVYVVPANIDNRNFTGSHQLIRDGATLIDHPDQILEELDLPTNTIATQEPDLSEIGEKILSVLSTTPITTEHIADKTGISMTELLSELTLLELEGQVLKESGGFMVKP